MEIKRAIVGMDMDARGIAWYLIRTGAGVPHRVGYIYRSHQVHGMYEDYPDDLVSFILACKAEKAALCIEDVHYLKNLKVYRILASVHAELRYEILKNTAQFDLEVNYVTASQWQAGLFHTLGIEDWKKATKVSAATAAGLLVPGMEFKNEHEVDACCIAHYWRDIVTHGGPQ